MSSSELMVSDGLGKRHRQGSVTTQLFTKMLYHKMEDDPNRNSGAWVIGMCTLETNPGLEIVRSRLLEKLPKQFTRFASRLTLDSKGRAHFKEVSGSLDLDYHIPDLSKQTENWTEEQVMTYLGELNQFQYDLTKPLWRYLLIPKLDNGKAVVISCVNHAIGDGLAQVAVTESLYDEIMQEPNPEMKSTIKKKTPSNNKKGMDAWSKFGVFLYGIYYGLTVSLTRPDPPNRLRLPNGQKALGRKRLAKAEPIPLERVKELKDKMPGTTVNDILMGLMTMTLKAYFIEQGTYKPGEKVTAQFPMSMRKKGEGGLDEFNEPHNSVSYAYFDFEFEGDRISIIWNTKHQIDCIKLSPSPYVVNWNVKNGLKLLPTSLMMNLADKGANLGTAQLSNVPGPQSQVSLFGSKVTDMGFYLFSPLACYLGILTYNGIVNAAFNLDSGLGVDPHDLARLWNKEFEILYKEVLEKGGVIKETKHDTRFYKNVATCCVTFLIAIIATIVLCLVFLVFQ